MISNRTQRIAVSAALWLIAVSAGRAADDAALRQLERVRAEIVQLSADRERFAREPVLELQGAQIGEFDFISSLADCGARRVRCLPLRQDNSIAGVLSLGFDAADADPSTG